MAKGKFSAPRSPEDGGDSSRFSHNTPREDPIRPVWNAPDLPLSEELLRTPEDEAASTPEEDAIPLFPETEEEAFPGPDGTLSEAGEDDWEEGESGSFPDTLMDLGRRAMDFCREHKKPVLVGVCAVALVLIVSVIAAIFAGTSDPYDKKILSNVYCGDVAVGGMTRKEAVSALSAATTQRYAQENMVIDLDGSILRLTPADVSATLDVKAAVEEAYAYGRTGSKSQREQAYRQSLTEPHYIGLLPYLSLNKDFIREVLDNYVRDTGATLTQTTYGLEGKEPELSADKFDPSAPGQTLVITMGRPGIDFDSEQVYQQILDAYSLNQFTVTVTDVEHVSEPDPLDLEAVYQEFYIAPQDASMDLKSYKVIPGSYGYDFDLERAKELVSAAGYGEEIRVPMEYIEPELLDENQFYRDTLAQVQTPHSGESKRTTNLRLACQAIDGLVLNPGETFSFNDTLGKRTADKGYQYAPAYEGDELVDSLGGGICQVSSTLYYAALLSDLEIVSRSSHSFPVSYLDMGLDATVSWGGPDFQFKNSASYPIRLSAQVDGGYVKIAILGTDRRGYNVKIESRTVGTITPETEYVRFSHDNAEGYKDGDVIAKGQNGYTVKTYKLKYDRETGERISEDFVASSQYKAVKRKVAQVEAAPTTEPTTEPTTAPSTEPSSEATEPSSEATKPSSEATEPTQQTDPTGNTAATEDTKPDAAESTQKDEAA